MKITRKMYEEYLNEIYDQNWGPLEYVTNKGRGRSTTTKSKLINYALGKRLGTVLRKFDPIAFNVGFNDFKKERNKSL
jgi:hypothetical protein